MKAKIFPIFQRTGAPIPSNRIEYFTPAQGTADGKEAVEAAYDLGFKNGTVIFSAGEPPAGVPSSAKFIS